MYIGEILIVAVCVINLVGIVAVSVSSVTPPRSKRQPDWQRRVILSCMLATMFVIALLDVGRGLTEMVIAVTLELGVLVAFVLTLVSTARSRANIA